MSKQRILVVENLDALRELSMIGLRRAGFVVDGAGTLQETLDVLDAKTFHFALVDLMLRDPDDYSVEGLQVLERLRNLGEGTVPIVLSGQDEPQTAADTLKQYSAFHYVAKSKLLESGMGYLLELTCKAVESTEIKKYGDSDSILSVLAGTDGAVAWIERCLRTLKPKKDCVGLKSFFTGFCEPMVPIMPQLGVSPPLIIQEERRLASGRFWSKGLGLPLELVACGAEEASELLDSEIDPGWNESNLLAEPYESHGLAGYAFHLKGIARSEFMDKL